MFHIQANKKTKAVIHALTEYFSHGIFIGIAYLIYFHLPYFQKLLQPEAKEILIFLIAGYAIFGLVYFIARDLLKPDIYLTTENKSTRALKFIAGIFTARRISLDEKSRVAVFSIVLKFFYFPIMLSFFIGNLKSAIYIWEYHPVNIFSVSGIFDWGYFLLLDIILTVDTVIFTFGYAFEAKWLKNEIKSVDPHISGWFFALICYPPFNNVVDRLTQTGAVTHYNNLLSDPALLPAFRVATLLCYLIYVWATIALWTKSSNLTNRGIVAAGPYKYVRHPAYVAKNIAWWLEQIPYLASWGGVIVLLMWNSIYVIRALTEERHLLKDSDYQKYVQKVKWRFVPGVV